MKAKAHKRKWGKPKLIVLLRGDMQEGVLQVCKAVVHAAGPNTKESGCWVAETPYGYCMPGCNVGSQS